MQEIKDYRFMPEPDLPPLILEDADLDRIRESLKETPTQRVERYCSQYGLVLFDAEAMALDPASRCLVFKSDVCSF